MVKDGECAYLGASLESVVDDKSIVLTHNKKVLLRWHYKLAHFGLGWIQSLMRVGKDGKAPVIPTPLTVKHTAVI
eukprot:1044229-Ditylum_brightwellii.AAC.1